MRASSADTQVLLLDLGGVVLGIDFRRVFAFWAEAAEVDKAVFYDHWQLDDVYKAHETGDLDFADYTTHLSKTLGVSMSDAQWREGWNALWTVPMATWRLYCPLLSNATACAPIAIPTRCTPKVFCSAIRIFSNTSSNSTCLTRWAAASQRPSPFLRYAS